MAAVLAELVIAWVHPEYDSFLERWGAVIADAAIAFGIVGEVIFSRKDARIQTELRNRSNKKLSAAEDTAMWALASSDDSAADAAEANKRAAEANERTAKAELERARLEAQLAPRMLTKEQLDLIESLKGKFFSVNIAHEADSEAWWFATELAKAFIFNGLAPHIFVRDPSVHSFSVMIFEPSGFDGARPSTVGPLVELFKDHQTYGSAAIISHLPTDILLNAGDDEARATLLSTPMVIIGGRFIVPPSHWPKPPRKA